MSKKCENCGHKIFKRLKRGLTHKGAIRGIDFEGRG